MTFRSHPTGGFFKRTPGFIPTFPTYRTRKKLRARRAVLGDGLGPLWPEPLKVTVEGASEGSAYGGL